MIDMEYEELSRMIDLRIADSLERLGQKLEFREWMILEEEIQWLRMP